MKPSRLPGQASPLKPSQVVTVAVVGKPHGLRGELRCWPETDHPERFETTPRLVGGPEAGPLRVLEVESVRFHKENVLLKFVGVDNPETAGLLRGWLLSVPEAEIVPLKRGEFYHYQVEGLLAVDPEGAELGRVAEVLANPAHEIYVIRGGPAGELLIPAVPEYLLGVDLQAGRVTVRPLVFEDDAN